MSRLDNWLRCYRLAYPSHQLEARQAVGGESYGMPDFQLTAKPGQWLCQNPSNGYRWVCSDEVFRQLYCEVGKTPPKKTTLGRGTKVGKRSLAFD